MNKDNNDRFVDPFSLPDIEHHTPKSDDRLSRDFYDVDLHDDYDWLAQPRVVTPPVWSKAGQDNES